VTDIITFLRKYDYDICLAKGNIWTLDEAVDYLAAYLTNNQNYEAREAAYQEFISIRDRLISAVLQGIDEGSLLVDEVYEDSSLNAAGSSHYGLNIKKSGVNPGIFINWAIDNNIKVPLQFAQFAARKKAGKGRCYETLGLKKSTIHHERCRAVAEMLWSIDPDIPIAEMARKAEVIQFGCEGREYDMRTISRWLASLKADRRPGNPGRNSQQSVTPDE